MSESLSERKKLRGHSGADRAFLGIGGYSGVGQTHFKRLFSNPYVNHFTAYDDPVLDEVLLEDADAGILDVVGVADITYEVDGQVQSVVGETVTVGYGGQVQPKAIQNPEDASWPSEVDGDAYPIWEMIIPPDEPGGETVTAKVACGEEPQITLTTVTVPLEGGGTREIDLAGKTVTLRARCGDPSDPEAVKCVGIELTVKIVAEVIAGYHFCSFHQATVVHKKDEQGQPKEHDYWFVTERIGPEDPNFGLIEMGELPDPERMEYDLEGCVPLDEHVFDTFQWLIDIINLLFGTQYTTADLFNWVVSGCGLSQAQIDAGLLWQTPGYTSTGDKTIQATIKMKETETAMGQEELLLSILRVDLEIDSDNNGTIDVKDFLVEDASPGKIVAYNGDDDDGDGTQGTEDDMCGTYGATWMSLDDNDLVPLRITMSGGPSSDGCGLELEATGGAGSVSAWLTQFKNTPFDPPNSIDLGGTSWVVGQDQIPSEVYVEGVGPGGATLTLSCITPDGQHVALDSVQVTVVKVTSVEWEKISSDLDDNENVGGGRRIFPGKQTPTDAVDRRTVRVKATITPALENIVVHFGAFDVDDPSANQAPVDDDQDETQLTDNRGSHSLSANSDVTNSSGEAETVLTVSMQPGDNFRAVGAVTADYMEGITAKQDDAQARLKRGGVSSTCFLDPENCTELLTVWRRLYLELDTMCRPTFAQNTVSGEWEDPVFLTATRLRIDVDIETEDYGTPKDEQFDNGFIKILAPGFPSLVKRVIEYKDRTYPWDNEVHITSSATEFGTRESGTFIMSDDDITDQDVFMQGVYGSDIGTAGTGAHLPLPDTTGLASVYKPAYIVPCVVQDQSGNTVPFRINVDFGVLSWGRAFWDDCNAVRGLPVSSSNYWATTVVSAFQPEFSDDADPDAEAGSGGQTTYGICTHEDGHKSAVWTLGSSYNNLCAIMQETLRDASETAQHLIVAHEIGHSLGCDHAAQGIMKETRYGNTFSPESLATLRSYDGP